MSIRGSFGFAAAGNRCFISYAACAVALLLMLFSCCVFAGHAPSYFFWQNNGNLPTDRFSTPEEAARVYIDERMPRTPEVYWTFDHVEPVVINVGTSEERTVWVIYYRYTNTHIGAYMLDPYTFDNVQQVFVCDPTPQADGSPRLYTIYPKQYQNGCPVMPVDPDKNMGPKNCVGNPINVGIGNKYQREVDYYLHSAHLEPDFPAIMQGGFSRRRGSGRSLIGGKIV